MAAGGTAARGLSKLQDVFWAELEKHKPSGEETMKDSTDGTAG